VGRLYNGAISGCFVTGNINGESRIGGLTGCNNGIVKNSYATAMVNGVDYVGGLVGLNTGSINTTYSTGLVNNGISSNRVGGLAGSNSNMVLNSYWAKDSSGQISSDGGTGKLLEEMKQRATFIGWDCDGSGNWTINEGIQTPRLAWENATGLPLAILSVYSGGSGSEEEPFLIGTAEDLLNLSITPCHWDKHFRLTNDITFDPNNNPAHLFTEVLIAPSYNVTVQAFLGLR